MYKNRWSQTDERKTKARKHEITWIENGILQTRANRNSKWTQYNLDNQTIENVVGTKRRR